MKLRYMMIALACLAGAPGAHADDQLPLIGWHVKVSHTVAGCKDVGDEDNFVKLMASHDHAAAEELLSEKGSACLILNAGHPAVVEDTSVWHNRTCVRPVGKPGCYWVPPSFVEVTQKG